MKRKKYTTKKTPSKFTECLATLAALQADQFEVVRKMIKHPYDASHQAQLEQIAADFPAQAENLAAALEKAKVCHNAFMTTHEHSAKHDKRKNAFGLLLEAVHIILKTMHAVEEAYKVIPGIEAEEEALVETDYFNLIDPNLPPDGSAAVPAPAEEPGALKPRSTPETYRLLNNVFSKIHELGEDFYFSFKLLDEDYGHDLRYSPHSEFCFTAECIFGNIEDEVELAKSTLQSFRACVEYTPAVYRKRQLINQLLKQSVGRLQNLANFWAELCAAITAAARE